MNEKIRLCGGYEGRNPAQCQPPASETPQKAGLGEAEVGTIPLVGADHQ